MASLDQYQQATQMLREHSREHLWRQGIVYFLAAGDPPHAIKVGWTLDRPVRRLYDLQMGNPFELRFVGFLPGTEQVERELHRKFSDLRMRGEWFQAHPDLLHEVACAYRTAPEYERTDDPGFAVPPEACEHCRTFREVLELAA